MKIAIAGGHGQIALLLARLITDAGHDAVAIVRNPAHVADVEQQGASAIVADLEQLDDDELGLRLRGVESNAPSGFAEAFHCRKATLTVPGFEPPQ